MGVPQVTMGFNTMSWSNDFYELGYKKYIYIDNFIYYIPNFIIFYLLYPYSRKPPCIFRVSFCDVLPKENPVEKSSRTGRLGVEATGRAPCARSRP